jgi:hypothetical protein
MTTGVQLSAHIHHLLQLNAEQQKATLASLSAYADKQRQENLIATASDGNNGSEFSSGSPMLVVAPRTDSFGAMLNAENCFATGKAPPTEPKKVLLGGRKAVPTSTVPLPSQAPAVAPWHKVVQELGSNLPKGVAPILEDLLAQAQTREAISFGQHQPPQTPEHTSTTPDGRMAAVRFLMQQLESDQQASVRKLHNMMGHPCSMDNGFGMNVLFQPSSTFSLPLTGDVVHESLRCKDLKGCLGSGVHPGHSEQSFVGATQRLSVSGGTRMSDSAPHGGVSFFSRREGHQQLAPEVQKSLGQPMERCLRQDSRRSAMKGQPQTPVSVGLSGETQETLRMHLRSLINVDPGRVLIVRKINRLGFASQAVLLDHFSWYGVVERVLVAHSRVKSTSAADKGAPTVVSSRLRPSGLGFVVMRRVEDAQIILANGSEQSVNGLMVRIQQFKRQVTADEEASNEDDSETVAPETSPSEENCNSPSNSSSCEESN